MMNKIPNLKYMTFLALLAATGIGYLYREPLEDFLDAAIEFGLKNYEESIDLPGEPLYGEKDAGEEDSDADGNGGGEDGSNPQTGDDPQTGNPCGNMPPWRKVILTTRCLSEIPGRWGFRIMRGLTMQPSTLQRG